MLSASGTQRTDSDPAAGRRAVGVGPPPVLGLPRVVDPRDDPRRRVVAVGAAGVGDLAELLGPGQVGRHVGRHHVERSHLEPVLPQHQHPDRAGLVQIADHDPGPEGAGLLGERVVGVLDQHGQRAAARGRLSASRLSSGMASSLSPITTTEGAGEADDQPVELGPEQGGHDAQRRDHQQQSDRTAGPPAARADGAPPSSQWPMKVGAVAEHQAEGHGQRGEERSLQLGAVPDAERTEHDAWSPRGRR